MKIQKLAYDLFTLSQIHRPSPGGLLVPPNYSLWLDTNGRSHSASPIEPTPTTNNVFSSKQVRRLGDLIFMGNSYVGHSSFDEFCLEIAEIDGLVLDLYDGFVNALITLIIDIPPVIQATAPVAAPVAPVALPHTGQLINITGKGITGKGVTVEKAIVIHVHNGKMWVDMYDDGEELIHMADVTITPWVEKTPEELRTEALVKLLESHVGFEATDELVNEINALFEGDE